MKLINESYLARPAEEVKVASNEERARAFNCAEATYKLAIRPSSNQCSDLMYIVVSGCKQGLPSRFCEDHLPKSTIDMVLENEEGSEYGAVYISRRVGLSGGWRAFALDHKLDDGDALVFELIEPTRFKVYIVRALGCQNENGSIIASDADEKPKKRKTNDSNHTEKPAEVSTRSLRKKRRVNL